MADPSTEATWAGPDPGPEGARRQAPSEQDEDLAFERTQASSSGTGRTGSTSAADSMTGLTPDVPPQIGRYLTLRRLGAGAMGVVLVAYDPELDRKLAIKLIHPRAAGHEEARTRMLREAKGLARVSHPNVVQVYDAGTIDGR
ncbi:MAG: hypothetical protein KC457_24695, partial [Myxococcales bacterium]|nr:hypothetical protein [Myxococcales bacterium]